MGFFIQHRKLSKIILLPFGHIMNQAKWFFVFIISFEMIYPVFNLTLLTDHQIHVGSKTDHLFRPDKGFTNPNPYPDNRPLC